MEDPQQTIRRIAANQIAKCVAKGTVGALYVPAGVARRAFPKADHAMYDEALELLDREGFLMWHKNRSCFGLAPNRYGKAVEFALANADEKRAAVLRSRTAVDVAIDLTPRQPKQQDWSDDEDVIENDPRAHMSDLEDFVTREDLNAKLASLPKPTAVIGAGSSDVSALRDENHRLRSEVGALRGQTTKQADELASIKARLAAIEKHAKILGDSSEELVGFVRQMKKKVADKLEANGRACRVNRCGAMASKPIPLYHTNGFKWEKSPEPVTVCENHARLGYCICFHRARIVNVDRLVSRLPRHEGVPLMCGPLEDGRPILEGLVNAGRLTVADSVHIRGVDDDSEPADEEPEITIMALGPESIIQGSSIDSDNSEE